MGAAGRMGTTVCRAVRRPDMELVAVIDPPHEGRPLDDFGVGGTGLTLSMLGAEVKKAEPSVAIDFTHVEAARGNLRWCGINGVHAVVGTTGLTPTTSRIFRPCSTANGPTPSSLPTSPSAPFS